MTVQEIRDAVKVMEAYANGKKIQYLNDDNEWIDAPKPFFDWHSYVYRINRISYFFLSCHIQSSKFKNTSLISPSFISAKSFLFNP